MYNLPTGPSLFYTHITCGLLVFITDQYISQKSRGAQIVFNLVKKNTAMLLLSFFHGSIVIDIDGWKGSAVELQPLPKNSYCMKVL